MKPDYFIRALIVVVLCLLVYLALRPDGKSDYLKLLKDENKKIENQINTLKASLQEKLDSLKIIEKKETIIRNYYNEIINYIDTVNNDSAAISLVRNQLRKLGPARLD